MSVPTLLTLPGEIRNLIYGYVLTPDTTDSLQYHSGDPGRKSYLSEWSDDTESIVEVEFNNLKYVNRQLYAETATLELKYTQVLVFVRTSGSEPGGALGVRFLLELSPKERAWLSTIRIQESSPLNVFSLQEFRQAILRDSPEMMSSLDRICIGLPRLRVQYLPPLWKLYPQKGRGHSVFFFWGALYSYILRGRGMSSILEPLMMMGKPADEWISAIRLPGAEGRPAEEWVSAAQPFHAPNLQFYPQIAGPGKYTKELTSYTIPMDQYTGQLTYEDSVTRLREWMNRGL